MEQQKIRTKKKNRKPLYLVLLILLGFILFFAFLMHPSVQTKAIKEIESSNNKEEVKQIWDKYKQELEKDDDFCQAVRDRLQSFGLKPNEIIEIKNWLPAKTNNLNIIVIPDLSHRRLFDSLNKPSVQVNYDTAIIDEIWRQFVTKIILTQSENPKDKFSIEVTDPGQAGEFEQIAERLRFDLSDEQNKSTRLTLENASVRIRTNLDSLYSMVGNPKHTAGAGFEDYFANTLNTGKRVMQSDINDNYRNILIIISDGTCQQGRWNTPSAKGDTNFNRYIANQERKYVPVPASGGFENVEAYIFEINKSTFTPDINVVTNWWKIWFENLRFKNSMNSPVYKHEVVPQYTLGYVKDIFKQ